MCTKQSSPWVSCDLVLEHHSEMGIPGSSCVHRIKIELLVHVESFRPAREYETANDFRAMMFLYIVALDSVFAPVVRLHYFTDHGVWSLYSRREPSHIPP